MNEREFQLIGRFDNIINSGGVKIQLEKIEKVGEGILRKLQLTKRFFVYSLPDEKLGERLILVVENEKQTNEDFIKIDIF